ncbi:MAG TPA: STAS domain-containing protein [Candidatus Thermoplasmatota archaeon]|nr:STAS domain-containing protein [Candidatus Thermoplasmatota archaeon]
MAVPILRQGDVLIASIQSAPTDEDLRLLQETLVERIGRYRTRGVVIDVTLMDVMDSYACRTLRSVGQMARLRGAETVLVGIQPDVAFSMVQLGLRMEGVHTALDLDAGLSLLRARLASRQRPSGGDGAPPHQ